MKKAPSVGEAEVSLEDLRLFAEVARRLNFGEAARHLGVPLSTVSRRVARLEEALGVRLLQRTSRRVGLTQEGARLLERAGPALGELSEALDAALGKPDEPSGRLRVTAPVVTGAERVAPALFAFAARHPKITLELRLTNARVDLVDEGFDLAFRAGPVHDRELVARRLWSAPFALAASAAFVDEHLRGVPRLKPDAVAALPGILTQPGGWRFRRRDGSLRVLTPTARLLVNDPRVAIAAAAAGLGVVCAPSDAIERHGEALVTLTVSGLTVERREVFAVYPSRRQLSPRVRLALDWIAAHG